MWAPASKAVIARRQLAVGSAVLRESPFAPQPEDTVPAMLQGIRAIGVRNALGWSDKTESWRQRVLWLRRLVAAGAAADADAANAAADEVLPDLSDAYLEATLEEWLAPLLPGVTSKSALRKLDGDGLLRCQLSYEQQMMVDDACPTHVRVPSGSNLPLDYGGGGGGGTGGGGGGSGAPVLRARLQELFGMAETPCVGIKGIRGGSVPVEVHLLSPASRPVQARPSIPTTNKP